MTKAEILHKHQRTITKAVFLVSLLILIVLASTILAISFLRSGSRDNEPPATGWQRAPEIRIIMDSTADWARIMFNDLYGTNLNGIRIAEFGSHGWLLGNDSDDRIDAGRGLTFVDIIYNSTVAKTGDIIGFFKGNNDFRHTKMYADLILEVNTDMSQVSIFIMLAGAGTTTFEFTNKKSGTIIWQDTDTGNSFTQYSRRSMSPDVFFAKERIEEVIVFYLAVAAVVTIVALNVMPLGRKAKSATKTDGKGL